MFGYGNGATGARSVNADDIDKALNYNKKDFVYTNEEDGVKYNFTYGWKTTYYGSTSSWNPEDTFTILKEEQLDKDGYYKRDNEFIDINGNVATDANPITIKSNIYTYTKDQFTDKIESNTLNTIFGDNYQFNFWLASRYVHGSYDNANWGLFHIDSDTLVGEGNLYNSYGSGYNSYYYVRPVVSLKSNIQGEKDASGIWQLK